MDREEIRQILWHDPLTFEQMKELQQMQLQHDWEALRNQAAISAMQGVLASENLMSSCSSVCKDKDLDVQVVVARYALSCADALVKELKGG